MPKTYEEVCDKVIEALTFKMPGGEGPNGEVVGAITIPFSKLTQEELGRVIQQAKGDGFQATEDKLFGRYSPHITDITFERIE